MIFSKEMSIDDRKRMLEENASSIEQTTYLKPLSQEELDLRREQLADNSIDLSELEDEKKETAARFKEQIAPLKDENKKLLKEIKTKHAEINGKVYNLPNYDTKMMETYDEEANLISSRRLRPDERQGNVFLISKAN